MLVKLAVNRGSSVGKAKLKHGAHDFGLENQSRFFSCLGKIFCLLVILLYTNWEFRDEMLL